VRVQGILELLNLLLPDEYQAIRARLASGRTQQVAILRRLPIMLGYWTAEVNSHAQLVLRKDIYSLDARLLAALRRPQY
jgi:murein L,D-transpeptidase YcbB/YkuD